MTRSAGSTIPFEGQADRETNRMCGAAALAMVYRSLPRPGKEDAAARRERRARHAGSPDGVERRRGVRRGADVTQAEILPHVSKPNRLGQPSCATHLMVKDALRRGYAAVAVQATHPLQALATCRANGLRAILNHRLKADGPAGHFTVLTGMDEGGVVLHDPFLGPSHRVPYLELLELWQPRFPNSEIVGNVLIGIATRPDALGKCPACSVPFPAEVPCPRCAGTVPLAPAELLGCVGGACTRRAWSYVCCPSCDFMWSFSGSAPKEEPPPEEGLWNLGPLFAALARLETHVLTVPAAAARPDVQQQLASIRENKEKLRLAEQEELARRGEEAARARADSEALAKEEAAIAKAREAAAAPAGPIDAGKLSDALLKDLGIVK